MNKSIIYIFICILLSSFVIAAPPFEVIQSESTQGLQVFSPERFYMELGTEFEFVTHISNISNGVPIGSNDGVCCYFHLYNESGNHEIELEDCQSTGLGDYSFKVNFTKLHIYDYKINCNSSDLGGVVEKSFEVTESGKGEENLDQTAGLSVVLFMTLITIPWFFVPLIKKVKYDSVEALINGSSILLGLGMLLMTLTTVMQIASKAWLDLTSELTFIMFLINKGIYIIMFTTVVTYFFKLVNIKNMEKEHKRRGEYE